MSQPLSAQRSAPRRNPDSELHFDRCSKTQSGSDFPAYFALCRLNPDYLNLMPNFRFLAVRASKCRGSAATVAST